MTEDQLQKLLRETLRPSAEGGPVRDVWPQIGTRFEQRPRWSYLDLGLAAAAAGTLVVFPEWLWPLAYHL